MCVYIYTQVLITYRIWGMYIYIYMYVRVFRNFLASSVLGGSWDLVSTLIGVISSYK